MGLSIRIGAGACLLSFAVACGLQAADSSPSTSALLTPERQKLIETYASRFPEGVHVSVALVSRDTAAYAGFKRAQGGVQAVDNKDAVFAVGSITKIFTSTILAELIQKGTIHLDDPLSSCFPFKLRGLPKDGKDITLLNLANHTSGLPTDPPGIVTRAIFHLRTNAPWDDYNKEWLENYLQNDMKLDFAPGAKYQYSNIGGGLLGHVLTVKTGKPYEDLLQEMVLAPLGMTSSSTQTAKVQAKLVPGRTKSGGVATPWEMGIFAGAGALRTSAADLVKFLRAQYESGDPAFALTRRITTKIDERDSVGLGWHTHVTKKGRLWYVHGGGNNAYTASLKLDPERRTGVVVLTNWSNLDKDSIEVENLCGELMVGLD